MGTDGYISNEEIQIVMDWGFQMNYQCGVFHRIYASSLEI